MAHSPLLQLSPELRNLIYEYALTRAAGEKIDLASREAPFTRTCRQIRREALLLYYSLNTFILSSCRVSAARFAQSHFFLTSHGRSQIRAIPRLEIDYRLSCGENQPVDVHKRAPRGGWIVLVKVLAEVRLSKEQVEWTAVSTRFDESVSGNYFEHLAAAARVGLYRKVMAEDWKTAVDGMGLLSGPRGAD